MNLATTVALIASLTLPTAASANDSAPPPVEAESPKIGADVEIDPLAYALGGASLHAGIHAGKTRFDLGVFALPVPKWLHGNEGMSRDGVGFGLKADRFFREGNKGLHLGVAADFATFDYQNDASGVSVSRQELMAGGRVGYRLQHKSGLYLNPWLGVSAPVFGGKDLTVGGKEFETQPVQIFPTVHAGWRIR